MNKDDTSKMTCDEAREQLEAYLDGQMDSDALKHGIEAHLGTCKDCQEEAGVLTALSDRIRSLPLREAPSGLHQRVESLAQEASPLERAGTIQDANPVNWKGFLAAAAIMLIMLGSLKIAVDRYSGDQSRDVSSQGMQAMVAVYIEDHQAGAYLDSENKLASNDPVELEAWFSGKLNYVPKIPRWSVIKPVNGQVVAKGSRFMARVNYAAQDTQLSLYIHPKSDKAMGDGSSPEPTRASNAIIIKSEGFSVACWRVSGLDFALVMPGWANSVPEFLSREG